MEIQSTGRVILPDSSTWKLGNILLLAIWIAIPILGVAFLIFYNPTVGLRLGIGTIVEKRGQIVFRKGDSVHWEPVAEGQTVFSGHFVGTGQGSYVRIRLPDASELELSEKSMIVLGQDTTAPEAPIIVTLERGQAFFTNKEAIRGSPKTPCWLVAQSDRIRLSKKILSKLYVTVNIETREVRPIVVVGEAEILASGSQTWSKIQWNFPGMELPTPFARFDQIIPELLRKPGQHLPYNTEGESAVPRANPSIVVNSSALPQLKGWKRHEIAPPPIGERPFGGKKKLNKRTDSGIWFWIKGIFALAPEVAPPDGGE